MEQSRFMSRLSKPKINVHECYKAGFVLSKCKKSEKALFEEPYEDQLFFEWSSLF